MNWINRVSVFGVGIVFGIALCIAIFLYSERFYSSQIVVYVVNNSDHEIAEIKIESNVGYLVYRGLDKNGEIALPLYFRGEGAYSINVNLVNGVILKGGLDYVESGYSSKELVLNDRIESKISGYY